MSTCLRGTGIVEIRTCYPSNCFTYSVVYMGILFKPQICGRIRLNKMPLKFIATESSDGERERKINPKLLSGK